MMTRLLLAILLNGSFLYLFAQSPCEIPQKHFIQSNRIGAYVYNDGSLFHNEDKGGFKIPYTGANSPSTIRKAALWIGGYDSGGNLKISAAAKNLSSIPSDFKPGPLDPTSGFPYSEIPCEFFSRIWTVTGEEITAFLEDWKDNQQIDDIHVNIFSWPGNGNPHFPQKPLPFTAQGWAPFFDTNGDEIYDPDHGDFPIIPPSDGWYFFIPNEISWCVYNDRNDQPTSGGLPTGLEIQQTTWTLDCDSQPEIENSVFVEYKFINRAFEDISGFYAGIWVDFDLGCPDDDYIGSMPDRDAFYVYNATPKDGIANGCIGPTASYGYAVPVMSVKFLRKSSQANLDYFMHYNNTGPSPLNGPSLPPDYYYFLTGIWKDGTPLTYGGNGYDQASTNYTKFAFPGNPNNNGEWSQLSATQPLGISTAIGSTGFSNYFGNQNGGKIQPGKSLSMTVAFTCHSNSAYNHIEIINKMQSDDLYNLDLDFFSLYGTNGPYCYSYTIEVPEEEEEIPFISGIYPNPTTGELTIAIPETTIQEVAVYNTAWQLLYFDKTPKEEVQIIDLQGFAQGLYFVRLKLDGQTLVRKVVVR